MKKTLTLCAFALSSCLSFAQTTIFSDDFTSGGANWTLGAGGNFDTWIVNNTYSCSSTTPDQGGGNYMHIYDDLFGDYCDVSGFYGSGSGGLVYSTMTGSLNTTAYTTVTLTFDWLCQGQTGPVLASYGSVDYSTDGGITWINITSPISVYSGQSTWTTQTITSATVPALAGQANLKFRFGFTNSGYGTNPAFGVDNISVTNAGSVSVAENKNENVLNVFPNPSKGRFTIALNANKENTLVITDAMGRTVLRENKAMNGLSSFTFDLSKEQKGIYFLRLIEGGNVMAKEIVLD